MLLALVILLAGCSGPDGEASAVTREAVPDATPETQAMERTAVDAACEGCHAAEAAAWRGSAHRQAWVDPVFRAEHGSPGAAWCVRCHAPLAVAEAPRAGADRGVGCTSCHAPHAAGEP